MITVVKENLQDNTFPEFRTHWISRWFFLWMNPLFQLGMDRPLEQEDLYKPVESKKAVVWNQKLEQGWKAQVEKNPNPKLFQVLWNLLFKDLILLGCLRVLSDLLSNMAPLLIRQLVNFVTSSKSTNPEPLYMGYVYAGGLFLLQIVSTVIMNQFFQHVLTMSLMVRAGLYSSIFNKSTKLSSAARQEYNSGKVTNIMTTDVSRIEQFVVMGNTAWTAPIQILVITILLCVLLGPSALVGIGLLILSGPFQKRLMLQLQSIRKQVAPITDSRVKFTQEIIEGIRVLKYFTWEAPFKGEVQKLRVKELALILKRALIQAFVMMIAFAFPIFASSITFIIYGLTNRLDPGNIFASLALFQQLRFPLMFLPNVLVTYAEAKIATERIQGIFLAPELDTELVIQPDQEHGVLVENAEFVWDTLPKEPEKKEKQVDDEDTLAEAAEPVFEFSLKDIDLRIPKGQLVAVVGAVGAGKSTLLHSLIGETKKVHGTVQFSGSVGYAPQQAWIQNATVKENILFGSAYDEQRYVETIYTCALEKDIQSFQDQDDTQIGERGINLSGGQKQRINIARLVYNNPDIVLMDDPLSAVDAHVGRHLFETCLLGALKDKTRILVTHQLHFLPQVDYILVFKNGTIAERGTFEELIKSQGEFAAMMESYGIKDEEQQERDEELFQDNQDVAVVRIREMLANKSTEARTLMQKEDRTTGTVKAQVWNTYFTATGGPSFVALVAIVLTILQSIRIGNDYWLVFWTNNVFPGLTQGQYILVYVCWGIALALFTFGFGVALAFGGNRAAKNLHETAISRIIRAPTSFFDSTPLGRIINRFSKDQDSIDNTLMDAFRMFLNTFANTVGTFGLIISATPWFAAPLAPVLVMYYLIQRKYRETSRELKRLDSISRSPLYALLGETLNGLPTIRAYGAQDRFIQNNYGLIDTSISPAYLLFSAARWLGIRFEGLGAVLLFFAALLGIIAKDYLPAAVLGLSLSYALQVTSSINWCIRQFTEIEIAMNAVERVAYYSNELEQEAPAVIESTRPDAEWPSQGAISFHGIDMKYAPDLPLVLKGVSFEIHNGEKIGVVGRTGSGKSSLMQTLFRMVEPAAGSIVIDGIDIRTLGLDDLRSRLGIIPQDPVLFSGTFRRNLDPFSKHSDSELWDALERASIKEKVVESGGLEGAVLAGGENLSVGQRQLLCLARSMLAKPKILVMDEATANIDYDSDTVIQKSIREDFKNSTVLTIAHRLNTVMDYDRILVLSAGEIVEYDSPVNLVKKEDGVFRSMVLETGNGAEALLQSVLNQ
jgi:ABC-type multidrug transport system fused ATPase/permease subunit